MLKTLGLSGLAWLTPMAEMVASAAERSKTRTAKSLILLWLDGGPSQLETFDPHPGTKIAEGTGAIDTNRKGIQLAVGMERVAEQMDAISIIRNVVSKEGDHERANYNVKTGFRPEPTVTHPSIGAILAHQLPTGNTEIPRHISILPAAFPTRGGFLGNRFDAFMTGDPNQPVPDVRQVVPEDRFQQRLNNVALLDDEFARGRLAELERNRTLHQATIAAAVQMMSSEQLAAVDVSQVSKAERLEFGDTPFGRGCLAAARLVDVGVRCVEVNLSGWDTHVTNHSLHDGLKKTLDPALAGLLAYLRQRDQLQDTIVMCCGEFGRTPTLNPAGGRDHWPHGFSIALAGGSVAGGRVIGETDPDGGMVAYDRGTRIEDVHATVLHALGIDHAQELPSPVNRPVKLSEGKVIDALLA
jgi:uncharacterized protein (DUF1501 family)